MPPLEKGPNMALNFDPISRPEAFPAERASQVTEQATPYADRGLYVAETL